MYMVFAFAGSAMIACTAPADVPLGGASPLWTMGVGPKCGDGPCGRKVCAAATVVQAAPMSAMSRVAMTVRDLSAFLV
jgi:hypothetical protein